MTRVLPLVIVLGACGEGVLLHPEAHERAARDAAEIEPHDDRIAHRDAGSSDGAAPGHDAEPEHDDDAAALPEMPGQDAGSDASLHAADARLEVTVDGPGRIESGELACDGTGEGCGADLPVGTPVTLTAVPSGDAMFGGWTGACTGQDERCELTLAEPQRIKVTFVPRYTLNIVIVGDVSCAGTGNGFVNTSLGGLVCRTTAGVVDTTGCSGRFLRGTEVELTAYPQEATVFQGYSGDCESGERTCTLRMNDDLTVNAMFCGLIH